MSEADLNAYQKDDDFTRMLVEFQRGKWQSGFGRLNNLIEKYPLEHDLRELRQEMQLRAAMDVYEEEDKKKNQRVFARKGIVRALIVLGVILLIVMIFSASASWIRQQTAAAEQLLIEQRRTYELSAKFGQAMQLIAAYRPDEAEALLAEIQNVDPEYPGVLEALTDAEQVRQLDASYQQAAALKKIGDWQGSLTIFETIPNYRDSTLQIQQIKREFSLAGALAAGDLAVREGNWLEAITSYENIRNQDPLYQREQVEERLYNSYINAARLILEEQPDSLDALQNARSYFGKALAIRPQDPKVFEELAIARQTVADRLFNRYIDLAKSELTNQPDSITALQKAEAYLSQAQAIYPNNPEIGQQRQMAQAYIQAMIDFNARRWDAVIKSLQSIYEADIDYANGTARQALYDAYIARGDAFLLNGRAQSALTDYEAAVAIAQLQPDILLRLFEAQGRVGNALGIMGNYQTAVYQYRTALEEANIAATVVLEPEVDRALKNAEAYATRGSFRNAYNLYKDSFPKVLESLQTVTHVVSAEDYLARLAREYQTTVAAILAANQLTDPSQLAIGDKLIVPVLPTLP